MNINEKILEALTDEMRAKVQACENSEDLIDLAKSEGVELSDKQMEDISGGSGWIDCFQCDYFSCHSTGGFLG